MNFEIQNIFSEIKSYSDVTSDSLKAFFDRNEVIILINLSKIFLTDLIQRI